MPLVALVDEGTASAAELLAGALQQHHRAVLVGGRTAGRGSVQMLYPIAGGQALLRLTTQLLYLPDAVLSHVDHNDLDS